LPEIGETVLKAFLTRRTLLLSDGFEGIKISDTILAGLPPPEGFCDPQRDPVHVAHLESDEQARRCCGSSACALGDAGGDRP